MGDLKVLVWYRYLNHPPVCAVLTAVDRVLTGLITGAGGLTVAPAPQPLSTNLVDQGRSGSDAIELALDAAEQVADAAPEEGHSGDAGAGDEGDEQPILDQRGALFLLGEEVLDGSELVLGGDVQLQHGW